jgi:hypothetical protein
LHAEWRDLPPGHNEVDFIVSHDARVTSADKAAVISHRLIAVQSGDEEKAAACRFYVRPVYVTSE